MGEEVLLMATMGSCCMICYKCSVLYITIAITIEMFVSSVAGQASFCFLSQVEFLAYRVPSGLNKNQFSVLL